MSAELELLKLVMEDLSSIKKSIQDIVRLEEKTTNMEALIAKTVIKVDNLDKRTSVNEIAIASSVGKATGRENFVVWVAALASAFLIAFYASNAKPANGAMIHKEMKVIQMNTEKDKSKGGKK